MRLEESAVFANFVKSAATLSRYICCNYKTKSEDRKVQKRKSAIFINLVKFAAALRRCVLINVTKDTGHKANEQKIVKNVKFVKSAVFARPSGKNVKFINFAIAFNPGHK